MRISLPLLLEPSQPTVECEICYQCCLVAMSGNGCYCMFNDVLVICLQADKLLSQDFQGMLDNIIALLPRGLQVMLYSATFPLTVEEFMVGNVHLQRRVHNLFSVKFVETVVS
jgi:hypothetical protein